MNDNSSTTVSRPLRVLITGRAGSGKSAVCDELSRRGFAAFDADKIPRLSYWFDTYKNATVSIDGTNYINLSRYKWLWSAERMRQFLGAHPAVFLCGGADNDFDFEDVFDLHFVLNVSPEVQVKRLLARTNNHYGKDPSMHKDILEDAAAHLKKAIELRLMIIDADKPIVEVVDDILENLR